MFARAVSDFISRTERSRIKIAPSAYGYFLGESHQVWRYIFGARIWPL
jgi:hypothetical protein